MPTYICIQFIKEKMLWFSHCRRYYCSILQWGQHSYTVVRTHSLKRGYHDGWQVENSRGISQGNINFANRTVKINKYLVRLGQCLVHKLYLLVLNGAIKILDFEFQIIINKNIIYFLLVLISGCSKKKKVSSHSCGMCPILPCKFGKQVNM